MNTFSVNPPEGSTPGVTIDVISDGQLAGYAIVTIPAGGTLGWDTHAHAEEGIILDGHVWLVTESPIAPRLVASQCPFGERINFRVDAGVPHRIDALLATRILARHL